MVIGWACRLFTYAWTAMRWWLCEWVCMNGDAWMALHVWLCLNGYAWILSVVWMVMCECLYSACFSMHERLVVRVWLCVNGYVWMAMREWLYMLMAICEWLCVVSNWFNPNHLWESIQMPEIQYIVWPTVFHWIPFVFLRFRIEIHSWLCFFPNLHIFSIWVP